MSHRPVSVWKRVLGALWYVLVLTFVLVGGSVAGWLSTSEVAKAIVAQELLNTKPAEAFEGRDHLTILVLGCDKDLYYGGKQVLKQKARSDMMMVARLDFRNNRISAISIPRDLRVHMPGFKPHKINAFHAIARDGQEEALAKRAVEFVLPIKIDRVVTLDFDAFQRMVDSVGGVSIDVKRRIRYRDVAGGLDYDFQPGMQQMNGYQAMCYVRHRHDDTDLERQRRQQQFMMAFRQSLMSHPTALPVILEESMRMLDNEFSPKELAATMYFARNVPADNIQLGQVPVRPGRVYVYLDERKLLPTLRELNLLDEETTVSRLR